MAAEETTGGGGFSRTLGPLGGGGGGGGGGSGKTLASIYAFGLSDDPAADNEFVMPGGTLAFPGYTNWGVGFDGEVEFFQNRAAIDLTKPPAYERIGMAGNISGAGGAGAGFFRIAELNDPAWNGTFAQLNLPWGMESAVFSRDTGTGAGHAATEYARRGYNPFGQSPHVWPDTGRSGNAMVHGLGLYSGQTAVVNQIELASGFGEVERLLSSMNNGANAQWLTHWVNNAAAPAAGDGPAWIVEASGDIGHYNPRAVLNAYQVTADPHAGAWGWALQAFDGATINQVATFDNTGGYVLGRRLDVIFETTFNAATAGTTVLVPAVAGKSFVPTSALVTVFSIATVAGTVTGAGSLTLGSNVTHDNWISAATGAALLSAAYFATGVGGLTRGGPSPLPIANPQNAAVSIVVTTPATGVGLTWTIKVIVTGYYI